MQHFLKQGVAIDAIAQFLWREPSEIRAKITELGRRVRNSYDIMLMALPNLAINAGEILVL